jgi:hypothetical protein
MHYPPVVETDYLIELLLDEATLQPAERRWLLELRGKWLEPGERRRLGMLHEQRAPRGRHGPMEAM